MELKQKRKIVIGLLALFSVLLAKADITDTLHAIAEIEIQATRLNYYLIGASVHSIDSNTLSNHETNSLAELLSQQSLIAVNNYGPGGHSSISIRGGAAHHASVVWNGINIQSPMHGGVNFSTLPVCFIDKAQIQYGGASTLFGSGNATGSLHMSEVLGLNEGLRGDFGLYAGSAHNFIQTSRLVLSNKRWASSLKFFGQENKNNFLFINTEKDIDPSDETEHPTERLEHSGYNQYGVSQSNKILVGKNSWIGTDFWFLNFNKDIPALMSNYGASEAIQNDRNMMYSAYYKYAQNSMQLKFQTGGFYNQVLYNNPMPFISNNNRSISIINIGELSYSVHKYIDMGFILEQKYEKAQSGNYSIAETRNILSSILSLRYHGQTLASSVNVRQELVDGALIPIVFSGGFDLVLVHGFSFKSQISRNYSLPTMNDLYWQSDALTTGNPELKPETGWSGEAGLYFNIIKDNSNYYSNVVVFNNQISNWIRWIPDSNLVWMPVNLEKGVSRGIEALAGMKMNFNSFSYTINVRYGFTKAIALEAGATQMTEGTQLWYVPKHKGNISISGGFPYLTFEYSQSIVGERTYDDAIGTLAPYTIGNIILKSNLPIKTNSIELQFSIHNIWNTSYQVRHSYAMPLRQYMIGIKYLLN
jgi:outer membrane cobalamin receptor